MYIVHLNTHARDNANRKGRPSWKHNLILWCEREQKKSQVLKYSTTYRTKWQSECVFILVVFLLSPSLANHHHHHHHGVIVLICVLQVGNTREFDIINVGGSPLSSPCLSCWLCVNSLCYQRCRDVACGAGVVWSCTNRTSLYAEDWSFRPTCIFVAPSRTFCVASIERLFPHLLHPFFFAAPFLLALLQVQHMSASAGQFRFHSQSDSTWNRVLFRLNLNKYLLATCKLRAKYQTSTILPTPTACHIAVLPLTRAEWDSVFHLFKSVYTFLLITSILFCGKMGRRATGGHVRTRTLLPQQEYDV